MILEASVGTHTVTVKCYYSNIICYKYILFKRGSQVISGHLLFRLIAYTSDMQHGVCV